MNIIKKYILYACVSASALSLASCDKDLNNEKKDVLTDATQWTSEANADIAINDVYDQLPDIYGQPEQFDNFTDDNDPDHYYASWKWKGGVIDPASTNYALFGGAAVGIATINRHNWASLYQAIRKCNNTMKQITLNKKNFSDAWYNKRMDELRFHRAFHYSTLLQNWGGVPLVLTAQTREDSAALFLKRSTFAETLDFITKSLDTILTNKYLAVKYNKGNADAGRATLGAALMLKAYMQLVAASPLHNSATYPGGADPNKLVTFGNVDPARWAAAAASFKKFMDDWGPNGGKQYNLVPDDSTIWYESNEYNPEVIFDRQYVANVKGSSLEYYGGVVYVLSAYQTWGNYNPTQELVDQFFMANGKPITDPTSGYNPQNPYANREPRFYKWIVYDGAPYKMDWMPTTDTVYTRIDKVKKSLNEIDFGLNDWTNTGYYFKKKLNPATRPAAGASGANYIYFRYTEVLLGYAEAQNEAAGPDPSVYSAINAIRSRAGLPGLTPGLSPSEMRDAIRRERRIELCFENKRFFDIKRWKIGEQVLTTDLHGMKITNTVPSNNSGVWQYTVIGLSDPPSTTVHPHSFVPKIYMQPIPIPTLNQNPNLVQTPGYN